MYYDNGCPNSGAPTTDHSRPFLTSPLFLHLFRAYRRRRIIIRGNREMMSMAAAATVSSSLSTSSPLLFFSSSSSSSSQQRLRPPSPPVVMIALSAAASSSRSLCRSSSSFPFVAPLLCRSAPESSLFVPHAAVPTGRHIDDLRYHDDDEDEDEYEDDDEDEYEDDDEHDDEDEHEYEDDDEDEEEEGRFPSYLKVFVGNLPSRVDSGHLARLFSRAGTVEMAEIIYDRFTGRSRGFGFVTLSTIEEVEEAVQQFDGYELGGRILKVNSESSPRKREFPSRGSLSGGALDAANRLFVGNLSWGVDDLALETLFSENGNVLEAKVIYDRESGRSRGFGFVTYSSAEEVTSALSSLNGIELDGREIRVMKAEAKPHHPF